VIAKNAGETTFQHSAVEEAGHDVVKESSPETMRAFESFLPHGLDLFVKGVHQEIQGSGLRIALLVDSLPAVAWRRRGDGHKTGIEARNMPIAGEALRINRLSGLGFAGAVVPTRESTRASTIVDTLQEKFGEPFG
jgi:hypothetical protein